MTGGYKPRIFPKLRHGLLQTLLWTLMNPEFRPGFRLYQLVGSANTFLRL